MNINRRILGNLYSIQYAEQQLNLLWYYNHEIHWNTNPPRLSLKYTLTPKSVSYNSEPEILKSIVKRNSRVSFFGSDHFWNFDFRDSTKMENMKKLNKKYFMTKILIKLSNPVPETRVSKLVYITIPCLKFWALGDFAYISYLCLFIYLCIRPFFHAHPMNYVIVYIILLFKG